MFVKDYMCDWVNSISEKATFPEVVKKMVEEKTNSIVIINKEGKPSGLVSSQTLIKQVVPSYLGDNPTNSMFGAEGTFDKYALKAKKLKVKDFMETDFHSLSIDDAMIEAAAYSLKGKQRFMPVINNEGELVGAITRTCIKNALYNVFFKDNQIDPKNNRDPK
jgi:predicted transcriptional regulator